VKGAKNRDAAHRFLDWTTDPKRQSVFTEIAFYSTTHPQAVEYLPAEERKNRSMFPANRARMVIFSEKEMEWIVDNLATINERWNLWLSK
jgi:putative spermidine/putrescine transport system substrate-binding protein